MTVIHHSRGRNGLMTTCGLFVRTGIGLVVDYWRAVTCRECLRTRSGRAWLKRHQ